MSRKKQILYTLLAILVFVLMTWGFTRKLQSRLPETWRISEEQTTLYSRPAPEPTVPETSPAPTEQTAETEVPETIPAETKPVATELPETQPPQTQPPATEPVSRYAGLTLTQEEKDMIAALVWVEAAGESEQCQQAVAEVILNRVAADNFPGSVKNVIHAEGQFLAANSLHTAQPGETEYAAVERAYWGPYQLPADVVFFSQYPANKNEWGTIGKFVFCHQW